MLLLLFIPEVNGGQARLVGEPGLVGELPTTPGIRSRVVDENVPSVSAGRIGRSDRLEWMLLVEQRLGNRCSMRWQHEVEVQVRRGRRCSILIVSVLATSSSPSSC